MAKGHVDLYFDDGGRVRDLSFLDGQRPVGFEMAVDGARNAILRFDAGPADPHGGYPIGVAAVERALEACDRAAEWLAERPGGGSSST